MLQDNKKMFTLSHQDEIVLYLQDKVVIVEFEELYTQSRKSFQKCVLQLVTSNANYSETFGKL